MVNNDKEKSKVESQLAELVRDKELLTMIEKHPDQACSVIVQAKLPKRKFTLTDKDSKRLVREPDSGDSAEERNRVLGQLMEQLVKIVGSEQTSLLKSAGSIVVNGTAAQMEQISQLDNIEAIWKNRELGNKKKARGT